MSDFTKKTLQAITERHIRPVPFWIEWLKNSAYWVGGALLVVLSALVTGISWHALFEIDWGAYLKADFSWWQIVLSGVPLFSFFLLAIFLWVSILLLHQTRRGYRYPMLFLAGIFFSTSVAFGLGIEKSFLDQPAERFLLYALPHTKELPVTLLPSAERQWSQPERGLLGGTVLSSDATYLKLLDSSQKLWTVDYSKATLSSSANLENYQDIKVIGREESDGTFQASEIKTWEKSPIENEQRGARIEKVKKRERELEVEKKKNEILKSNDTKDEEQSEEIDDVSGDDAENEADTYDDDRED